MVTLGNVTRIILASGSPRRRELLAGLNVNFEIMPADIDESALANESAHELVARLSAQKAQVVSQAHPEALIIAADTVVVLNDEILGKPVDAQENLTFLTRLSGQEHTVMTGHALAHNNKHSVTVVKTRVRFRELSAREKDWYVATGEGLDKAGGYAIQGYGAALIPFIEGDYFNVVGLSVATVVTKAHELGVDLV